VTAILLHFWPYILAGAVALFGAWKIDRNATNRERAKQAASEVKARTVADEIDDAVAGRSPDANRTELGKWGRKP